jgi:hypothetical protein
MAYSVRLSLTENHCVVLRYRDNLTIREQNYTCELFLTFHLSQFDTELVSTMIV